MDFTKIPSKLGLSFFWLISVLLVFLLAGFFTYFFIANQQYNHTNLDKLQASIQQHINRRLQYEVNDAIHFANARYHSAEQVIMTSSQHEVTQALDVMNRFYEQNRRRMSDVELKRQLLELLRGVRFFNGRGYLFVGDQQGKGLLMPTQPELEGTSMMDVQDDQGVYFIRRVRQVTESAAGRGYVRYRWYSLDDRQRMENKIAFVARFEPYNWLVGAGDYVSQIQQDLQQEVIEYLQGIQFGKNGYLSIIDLNGKVIAGQGVEQFVGKTYMQLENPADRARIATLLGEVKSDGFIHTGWYRNDGQPDADQLLYASVFPAWGWIVLAGGYADPSLELLLQQRAQIMQNDRDSNITLVLLMAVLLSIAFVMMRYYARGFSKVFSRFQLNLDQQSITLDENARALDISERIVDAAHEGILITDADNHIIRINKSFTRITGYILEDVKGKNPRILGSTSNSTDFYKAMWHALTSQGQWHGEIWNRRKNGSLYPQALSITSYCNAEGEIENYIGTFTDISQRKAFEEQLEHMAQSDSLTDLPNRRSLSQRLQHELDVLKRHPDHQLGLMFMDLDLFKTINDTYGHGVGDQVLITIARRLNEIVRVTDMVSRVGGDEFVILLGNEPGEMKPAAMKLAQRIIEAISEPLLVAGIELQLTTSIGVALAPKDSSDAAGLMECADRALYQAKKEGSNNVKLFNTSMVKDEIEL
ncbi:cache domain-containing protein [Amphritea sp. 2_MG-2023]|uniref:sensor domain-containing diguanylate cyclase n=1 Tax=Amphritea TaxID=515417 RepID=UPI001C07840A|nr:MULTISPECIES: cache domain-containing protein [Amphritea]MBU2965446.1 cache domain-containing protein [Amphritea atlantica]MDO6418602.1 cache domain-containing protein [Amphritea sp. 2_MG-2023]